MASKYETAGACPLPEPEYLFSSPLDEYVRSPEAPTLVQVARNWTLSYKYMLKVSNEGQWSDKRREYQDANDVANIPEGEPRLCKEDRDICRALTYDYENGIATLDQLRIAMFPPILRGLIAQTGSKSEDVAHRAMSDISKLIAARPTDAPEAMSRHERTKPDTIEGWMAQLNQGEMPDELVDQYKGS